MYDKIELAGQLAVAQTGADTTAVIFLFTVVYFIIDVKLASRVQDEESRSNRMFAISISAMILISFEVLSYFLFAMEASKLSAILEALK